MYGSWVRKRSLGCRRMKESQHGCASQHGRPSQHGCVSQIKGDHPFATLVFLNQNFQPWRALTGVSRRYRQAVSNMPELNTRVKAVWNQLPEIYRRSQGLHQTICENTRLQLYSNSINAFQSRSVTHPPKLPQYLWPLQRR